MPISPPARRLTLLALTLALSLAVLAAALLGPAQTLAQTHGSTCSTSAAHSKAKTARTCARSSHKGKAHHATGRRARRTLAKKTPKASTPASPALAAAYCEDGSAPVRAGDGSFSCDDGSEPECEDGATPTVSPNGKDLLCPVSTEEASGSSEAQCEEGLGCGAETGSAPAEQGCEALPSDGSSFVCEGES